MKQKSQTSETLLDSFFLLPLWTPTLFLYPNLNCLFRANHNTLSSLYSLSSSLDHHRSLSLRLHCLCSSCFLWQWTSSLVKTLDFIGGIKTYLSLLINPSIYLFFCSVVLYLASCRLLGFKNATLCGSLLRFYSVPTKTFLGPLTVYALYQLNSCKWKVLLAVSHCLVEVRVKSDQLYRGLRWDEWQSWGSFLKVLNLNFVMTWYFYKTPWILSDGKISHFKL